MLYKKTIIFNILVSTYNMWYGKPMKFDFFYYILTAILTFSALRNAGQIGLIILVIVCINYLYKKPPE